jgi:hypothetical protein
MEDGLLVAGWLLLPSVEFDSMQLRLNGDELASSPELELRDIREFIRGVPHAKRSGFRVVLIRSLIDTRRVDRVDVLGCNNDRPIARMSNFFRTYLDNVFLTPSSELILRVAATQNPHLAKFGGFKSIGDFLEAIYRYRDLRSGRRLLEDEGRCVWHFSQTEAADSIAAITPLEVSHATGTQFPVFTSSAFW